MNKKLFEFYQSLDEAISRFTNEEIDRKQFEEIIDELNKNEFGVKIDKNLIKDNRVDFNEDGAVSYTDNDDSSYLDSSYLC
jgi:excinuclease UvrABC helicase subunit UvrB